ncbi:MAG: MFS transporter, partial [Ignavibacteriales bacterium UTCHB3]
MLQMQKKLSNLFYTILPLPATAMGFALSIQIAALSWLMNTKYHLNLEEIGFVWAAGPAAGIIGQVVVGLISDNVWFWGGRRRPFVLIGGVTAAVMLLALPNIDVISDFLGIGEILIVAVGVALALDLAINISFNPTRSIIADVTPEGEARTKGYTWMQTISGFFGVVAYLISVLLDNYYLIYIGVFFVAIFSILPMFFIKEPRELSHVSDEEPEEITHETNTYELMKVYIAHAFSWIGVQMMFVYIVGFIKQVFYGYEISAKVPAETEKLIGDNISISFAILNTVGFIVPVLLLTQMAKRIGRVKTHVIVLGIMAIGYLVIAQFVESAVSLYVVMVFLGLGWGSIVSLPFAIMSENVKKEKMGLYMGIFNLSVVLPQLLVSFVGGKVVQSFGNTTLIFVISGVSLAISALLWLFV